MECACASVASLLLINSRRHKFTHEVYRKLMRNRRTDAIVIKSPNNKNNNSPFSPSLENQRLPKPTRAHFSQHGTLFSGHHRGHQICRGHEAVSAANLLISLITGVYLGPWEGASHRVGAPFQSKLLIDFPNILTVGGSFSVTHSVHNLSECNLLLQP